MITQFRGLKPNYAKSIIMSHFYNCREEIIDLISLIVLLDGRFDELFKVNKNISINKKFRHENSDHLTLLNVIRAYNKYVYGSLKMSRKTLSRSQFLKKKLSIHFIDSFKNSSLII